MIITLRNSPSQRAAQEQEHLKQAIDHKLEEIEAGYYILLGCLDTEDDEYKKYNLQEDSGSPRSGPSGPARTSGSPSPRRRGPSQAKGGSKANNTDAGLQPPGIPGMTK